VRSYWISDVLVRHRALPRGRYELPHEVPGVMGEEMNEVAATRGRILILTARVNRRSRGSLPALLPWRYFGDYPPLRGPELSFYPRSFRNGWSFQFLGAQWADWFDKPPRASPVSITTTFQTGVIPLVWPFLLFAAVSLLCGRTAMRASRRVRAGRCVRCSYNLTGNTSGVCPECGTVIKSTTLRA